MSHGFRLLILLMTWLLPILPSAARAEDLLRRFQEEGITQLTELEDFCLHLEGTMDSESPNINEQGVTQAFLINGRYRRNEIVRDYDKLPSKIKELTATTKESHLPYERVFARNSRHVFWLNKRNAASPYLIKYCGKDKSDFKLYLHDAYTKSIFAHWCVNFKPLREWHQTRGFMVKSVTPVVAEGKHYARVSVHYATDRESKDNGDAGFTGELLLDPERKWCICKADYVLHFRFEDGALKGVPYAETIEFGPPIDNMPMPRIVNHAWKHPPVDSIEKWTITRVIHRQIPESEFTLRAFGLPDVDEGVGQEGSYVWLYVIVFGSFVGLGAIVMAWQAYRKRKAAA